MSDVAFLVVDATTTDLHPLHERTGHQLDDALLRLSLNRTDTPSIFTYSDADERLLKVRFLSDAARFQLVSPLGYAHEGLYKLAKFAIEAGRDRWPRVGVLPLEAALVSREVAQKWADRMALDARPGVRARVVRMEGHYRVEGPTINQALRDYVAR